MRENEGQSGRERERVLKQETRVMRERKRESKRENI